jgi:hypothetical protein
VVSFLSIPRPVPTWRDVLCIDLSERGGGAYGWWYLKPYSTDEWDSMCFARNEL